MGDGTIEKQPKGFIRGDVLKNYAGAIAILLGALPAVGSLVVSVVTAYRGEPVAEKTWTTVRSQLNRQAEMINKLHLRMVHIQAHEEGKTSAAIQLKLDELQKKYDQLQINTEVRASAVGPTSLPESSADCQVGHIKIDNKCRSVAKSVAVKVKADERKTEVIQKSLDEEKLRRLREEKIRRQVDQKIQKAQSAQPMLKQLPPKLDDAAKGNH